MPQDAAIPVVPVVPTVEIVPDPPSCCCNCSEEIPSNRLLHQDGEDYCEDCHSDLFGYCEQCGEYYPMDDAVCCGDDYFCSERCAHRANYYRCSDCGRWHNIEEGGSNEDGESICWSCYDEYYTTCSNCEEICHIDRMDDDLCPDCANNNNARLIKRYDFCPREFLFEKMPWENTVYLGIELEVECGDKDREELARKLVQWLEKRKLQDRLYIKEDSSLEYGFELVFMPTTLQALHKKFPMREFLKYCKRIGLESEESGSCGLHVHISRTELSSRDLWAGKLFFYKCKTQLAALSGRDDFHYCKFDDEMPKSGHSQPFGRYSAFNTSASQHTVEIRVFRGTLAYDRFQASLQFSDLFAEYMQQVSVTSLKRKTGAVIWAEFLAFAKGKNKYQQFLKYCKQKGIR